MRQIKVAANFSAPLLALVREKKLTIDLVKLSVASLAAEEGEICRQLNLPVLIHYLPDLGAARATWQNFDFETLNGQVRQWQVPHLSLHLDAYESVAAVSGKKELLGLLLDNFNLIKEKVSVPVLVENVDQEPDWNPAGHYDRYAEVFALDFVKEFFTLSGADFLLDVSHARCLTHFWQMPTEEYLAKLPLARVREIHTNGPKIVDGEMCDVHEKMVERDYQLLNWAVQNTRAEIVTLEYGGVGKMYETTAKNDRSDLQEQLEKIKAIISY